MPDGLRQRLQRLGPEKFSNWILRQKRLLVTDTTFRDAQQCLWATRMTTPMMLPVAERLDQAGFDVIEVVGAVQFDACVRYLGENPWERLRQLRAALPNCWVL